MPLAFEFADRKAGAKAPAERKNQKENLELVAHVFLFGLEVAGVVGVCHRTDGRLLDDLEVVSSRPTTLRGLLVRRRIL
jgi:hypothetical protein